MELNEIVEEAENRNVVYVSIEHDDYRLVMAPFIEDLDIACESLVGSPHPFAIGESLDSEPIPPARITLKERIEFGDALSNEFHDYVAEVFEQFDSIQDIVDCEP